MLERVGDSGGGRAGPCVGKLGPKVGVWDVIGFGKRGLHQVRWKLGACRAFSTREGFV